MRKKLLITSLSMVLVMSGCSGTGGSGGNEQGTDSATEAATEAVTEEATEVTTEAETETEEATEASTEKRTEALVEPSTEILNQETTEDVESQFEEYMLSSIENLNDQLVLIAENSDKWKIGVEPTEDEEVLEGPGWHYAVTDFDMNGRLEIVTSEVAGTGMYTTSKFYEVSEDFTSIEEVKWDFPAGDSEPDITVEMADAFMDKDKGEYYYIFDDVLNVSAADIHETLYSLCLKDGEMKSSVIGSSHMYSSDDGENVETEYKDKNGKIVTLEEYEELDAKEYPNSTKGSLTIGWNKIDGFDNEFPEDAESIRDMLEFSSTGFAISFE